MNRSGLALPLLLLTALAPAQEPTFRADTKLVEVSVIAQDKDSKPVTDLTREDFQIFDNDAPQEIRLFLAEKSEAPPAGPKAPDMFTNRIGRGGYSVIFFDNLNIGNGNNSFGQTARARIKSLQALKSIPNEDSIAIYALGCRFKVVREFTPDRDSLLKQLNAFGPAPGPCQDPGIGAGPGFTVTIPWQGPLSNGEPGLSPRAAEGLAHVSSMQQVDAVDAEVRLLADHLAGIPGRKSLIWLTTTFRLTPANLQRLINANVAIYPVDILGSMIATPAAKKARYDPMRALAAMTGGVAFFDRDDLDAGVRQALGDARVRYSLGFYPADDTGDRNAVVHRISVRLTRPGVTLRYRTSYQSEPPQPATASPVADLVKALYRPVDATPVAITAKAARTQTTLDLYVSYDIAALDLEQQDGLWKGKTEIVARFMAADGIPAGDVFAQTVTFNVRPATYESWLQTGAPWTRQLDIPAKAVELKLLVGNIASGKIGTLTIPLSSVPTGQAK